MVVGFLIGVAGAWWLSARAADGTALVLLPSAEVLALLALAVLAFGWVIATVAPRLTAGLSLGLLPGVLYMTLVIDAVDSARASALLGTVAALAGLGVGCALESYRQPAKRHHRFPPRPRVSSAERRR